MNNERRKLLIEARDLLERVQSLVEEAAEGERDYYDNMPESIQSGERGERASEVADQLEELGGQLSDAIGVLDEAVQ